MHLIITPKIMIRSYLYIHQYLGETCTFKKKNIKNKPGSLYNKNLEKSYSEKIQLQTKCFKNKSQSNYLLFKKQKHFL